MEIHWREGHLSLEQAGHFKAFKVVIVQGMHPWSVVVVAFAGLGRFEDAGRCWISQAGLCSLAGPQATPAWRQSLQAMVDMARPHGWVDAATGDIRAHVEKR